MFEFIRSLLICSFSTSVLALIYLALQRPLTERYSPRWLYAVWLAVMALFAIPFRPKIEITLPYSYAQSLPETVVRYVQTAQPMQGGYVGVPVQMQAAPPVNWYEIAFWVWSIGLVAFLAVALIRNIAYMRGVRRWSTAVTDEALLKMRDDISKNLGITRRVDIFRSTAVRSPMLAGFIRPAIYLPHEAAGGGLRYVLTHELVHYARRDMASKAFILAAVAVNWFNPAAYVCARAAALQCELACDREVIKNSDKTEKHSYTDAILAAACGKAPSGVLTTNFYGGKKGMKTRIASILDKKRKRAGVAIVCAVLVFTMGTSVVLAAEAPPVPEAEAPIVKNIELPQNVVTDNTPNAAKVEAPEPKYVPEAKKGSVPQPEPTGMPQPEPTGMPQPEPTEMPQPEPTGMPQPRPTARPTVEPPSAEHDDGKISDWDRKVCEYYGKFGIVFKEGVGITFNGKKIREFTNACVNYKGAMYLNNYKTPGNITVMNLVRKRGLEGMAGENGLEKWIVPPKGQAKPKGFDIYIIRDSKQYAKGIGTVKSIASDGRINPPQGYKPYK